MRLREQSPVLHTHLNPKRHVHAPHSLQDCKVLSRFVGHVLEGPHPGISDQREKLPHAEFAVVVHGDLHGGLKLRASVEEVENLLLDVPVLPSHENGQAFGVHVELRPGSASESPELQVAKLPRHRGKVQGQALDSPADWLIFLVFGPIPI